MTDEIKNIISSIINEYNEVSLYEIESRELLNRYDTKFVFAEKELPEILYLLKDDYKILETSDSRIFNYENIYFDTDDFYFYRQHHNGKCNRQKVRYRKYKESDVCYFEIKNKTNKNKVRKYRIREEAIADTIEGNAKKLVYDKLNINSEELHSKLRINYKRITLIKYQEAEKITFDTDLYFRNCNRDSSLPGVAIAELKNSTIADSLEFISFMKSRNIHPFRVSKYCTGTILTNPDVKYNRFKYKMLFLNKLQKILNG